MNRDRGAGIATLNVLLLVLALVLFLLAAFCDFGWLGASSSHTLGLVALGLASFAAAHLPL